MDLRLVAIYLKKQLLSGSFRMADDPLGERNALPKLSLSGPEGKPAGA